MRKPFYAAVIALAAVCLTGCLGSGESGSGASQLDASGSGGSLASGGGTATLVDLAAQMAPLASTGRRTIREVGCASGICVVTAGRIAAVTFDGKTFKAADMFANLAPALRPNDTAYPIGNWLVACSSRSFCLAVGQSDTSSYSVWNGSTWTGAISPTPIYPQEKTIACPADGTCYVVSGTGTDMGTIVTFTHGGWVSTGAQVANNSSLTCANTTYCYVHEGAAGRTWRFDGSNATRVATPVSNSGKALLTLTCARGPFCVGVTIDDGILFEDTGAGLHPATGPTTPLLAVDQQGCLGRGFCLVQATPTVQHPLGTAVLSGSTATMLDDKSSTNTGVHFLTFEAACLSTSVCIAPPEPDILGDAPDTTTGVFPTTLFDN